jgi:autotransporter-associated beta strand protein
MKTKSPLYRIAALFALALLATLAATHKVEAQTTTIDFDTAGNWTGSGSLTSYSTSHVYTESGWTFTGGPALRNTTTSTDGFAGALGTYSWRLRDDTTVSWTATYNTGGTLSAFGFDVRRWDATPSVNFLVEYSINGGTSYTSTGTTINNTFLGNSSDWSTFTFDLLSPVSVAADDFIVRVAAQGTTERMMIDNFSFTLDGGGPVIYTTWTGTGSGGTWSNGGAGNFGGNYADDLANTVTFTGTGETVATSGTPQAGSVAFNSDGFTVSGAVQLGVGTVAVGNAAHTATISADISGNSGSGLTKSGDGVLVLSGNNSYTGATAIDAGVVQIRSANALGTTGNGTIVGSGATLELAGTVTTSAEALSLNGEGVNGSGALRNASGNNTYAGAVTLTTDAHINSSADTLTVTGGITGTGRTLTVGGNGNVTISTGGINTGASGQLVKEGDGDLTISAAGNYAGGTTIEAGAIVADNDNALGEGTVAMTSGSTLAASGVTLANDFTIGSAAGSQVYYTQNFNDIGTGLPTDWTVRTGANASALGTTAAFTTTEVSWADTGSGFKNYASATGLTSTSDLAAQNASTDRALGARQSSSFGDPGASFNYAFSTTGEVLDSISLDLMVLDVEARSTTWSIEYGIGAAPTSFTLLGTWTDPGTWGTTTLTFDTTDFGTALDNQANLVFRVAALSSSTGSGSRDSMAIDNFEINAQGPASGSGTLGISEAGTATFSGNILNNNAATFTAASGGTATFSGAISGEGTLSKTGIGTVTLSGASANTFTGMTTVSAGTLQLNKTAETDAIAGDIEVNDGAFLLLSSSGNVADTSEITLSGGTILRDGGVSEVFGALTLGLTGGTLDFGTGATGTLGFGEYAPSALLTINNFFQGNTLTFGSDLSESINNASLFSFDNGFTSSWSSGTSTFTITAIPEPSTYLAAAGLLSLMLWPSRKRIVRDAKKILGFTPPMRDRLAARSKA